MASTSDLKELDVTTEEVQRLGEALKNEEFRKLFAEYAEEISDPVNKKRYEEEIRQLEEERGVDVQFVHPKEGYVIKTSVDSNQKAFINICTNDLIGKPSMKKQLGPNGHYGMAWSIPHSFSPVREELDKNKQKCPVYDFIIHADTYRMAETNKRFKDMIHDTACDGIEKQFSVKLDRNNLRFPKIKYKGVPVSTVIRSKNKQGPKLDQSNGGPDILKDLPYPYDEPKSKQDEDNVLKKNTEALAAKPKTEFTEPNYTIKHSSTFELQEFVSIPTDKSNYPKELIIDIDLPLLSSANPINLDIYEKRLLLESEHPVKYRLDLTLPYAVNDDDGTAKFDKSKRKLTITLPVIQTNPTENRSVIPNKIEEMEKKPEVVNIDNIIHVEQKNVIELCDENGLDISSRVVGDSIPSHNLRLDNNKCDVENYFETNNENVTTSSSKSKLSYLVPECDVIQDDKTITFVLGVRNTVEDSVHARFPASQDCCHVKSVSMGSGCFPIHYSFYIQIPSPYKLQSDECCLDVSDQNIVIVLVKASDYQKPWQKIKVGLDEHSLKEKVLSTEGGLQQQLDELDTELDSAAVSAPSDITPDLEVLDMSDEKLTLLIQDASVEKSKRKPSESAEDIEVVYENEVPSLHGILKQRTVSESSDDVYGCFLDRQGSWTSVGSSEGCITESDENSEPRRRKKSVSFSEYIDRTTYKSGQSVTSMKTSLKSKRRRARKREQKQHERQEKKERRRRLSSSSDHSSDELLLGPEQQEENESGHRSPLLEVATQKAASASIGDRRNAASQNSQEINVKENAKTHSDGHSPRQIARSNSSDDDLSTPLNERHLEHAGACKHLKQSRKCDMLSQGTGSSPADALPASPGKSKDRKTPDPQSKRTKNKKRNKVSDKSKHVSLNGRHGSDNVSASGEESEETKSESTGQLITPIENNEVTDMKLTSQLTAPLEKSEETESKSLDQLITPVEKSEETESKSVDQLITPVEKSEETESKTINPLISSVEKSEETESKPFNQLNTPDEKNDLTEINLTDELTAPVHSPDESVPNENEDNRNVLNDKPPEAGSTDSEVTTQNAITLTEKADKPSTVLSWEEPVVDAKDNPHKTTCAFAFTNTLMYELDMD